MNKLSESEKAYIAGFLDGDGSIYVKLTANKTYRFRFQIAPYIVFYQSTTAAKFLGKVQKIIGCGYMRNRNDGISELIIGDMNSLKSLLNSISENLIFKKEQAKLMLKILDLKEKVQTIDDFYKICAEIDKFKKLNYSKKRTVVSKTVHDVLEKEKLLTP